MWNVNLISLCIDSAEIITLQFVYRDYSEKQPYGKQTLVVILSSGVVVLIDSMSIPDICSCAGNGKMYVVCTYNLFLKIFLISIYVHICQTIQYDYSTYVDFIVTVVDCILVSALLSHILMHAIICFL